MINQGIELMNTDGILAALSIQGILFLFLAPTIFAILCFYIGRRIKDKLNKRKKAKQVDRAQKEEVKKQAENGRKEAAKILDSKDNSSALEKLHDLTIKPDNMKDFRRLELTFDESGNVQRSKD